MLNQLQLRNFAVVEQLSLDPREGLTVLTGETGAGKSILIDALTFVLGARADSDVIRQGQTQAEISAVFEITHNTKAINWLKENELYEVNECILRRIIYADKPSKGFINGRPTPIQMLREVGTYLVDVHGQHEHQSLLKRDAQREILDDYADIVDDVQTLSVHYGALRALQEKLEQIRQQTQDRSSKIELLRHEAQELQALNLAPDEYAELEAEHDRLAHGVELQQGAQSACLTLLDDEERAAVQIIARAQQNIEKLAQYDKTLEPVKKLLQEGEIQITEAAEQLSHYLNSLNLDPERLDELDRRIQQILQLARKHRVKPEELPAKREQFEQTLDELEHAEVHLEKIEGELATKRAAYLDLAKRISARREKIGKELARKVTAQLHELGMSQSELKIALQPLPEGELSAYGVERVAFLIRTNPGEPHKPLAKIASGGELSRISLALQVAAARACHVPTLIFDEIDVGIGGRVAEVVGRRLRELATSRQILCITHLPQVAAQGQHHLRIDKKAAGKQASTTIDSLQGETRVQELARMMGGIEINAATLAHAEDMLSRATT